jgi:predicted CXXCH cytochrome family protein
LALALVGAAAVVVLSSSNAQADSIHGPYSLTTTQCATCHRAHTGGNVNLLAKQAPQSNLCFTCHDGTGGASAADVAGQYSNGFVGTNDPSTRTYYTHDALAKPTSHISAGVDEFAGVLDRHSECGDCHNPHSLTSDPASQTATGNPWKPSGALLGISGVGVTNGPAGLPPLYTFFSGSSANPISFEYQLCLKCHSGSTVLPDNAGFPPSQWYLDKGIELNPANESFHPIEAAGTNATAAMAGNLSGPSAYRRWTFSVGSTVRCGNCHSSAISAGSSPTKDGDLAPHVSENRGILLAPYRDRQLMPTGSYNAANFALCFTCHSMEPFTLEASGDTNFGFHFKHMVGISGSGTNSSTDIDTPGAGRGNAICAECHFRLHSTALTDTPGTRLVSFSPNVTASGGVRAFTKTASGGTCTLVCHGENHNAFRYP